MQICPASLIAMFTTCVLSAAALGDIVPPERTEDAPVYAIPTTSHRTGRIIVEVKINGGGPYRFMIDTGANRSVVAASLLPALGLVASDQRMMQVRGINGVIMAPSVMLQALDAGLEHMHDIELPVLSGEVLAGIDGILGLDVLNHRTMSADFVHDRVLIGPEVSRSLLGEDVVPARILSGRLFEIDGWVGEISVKIVIDTGSPRTIANNALRIALRRAHALAVGGISTGVLDATDVTNAASYEPVPSMRFGNTRIEAPYVAFGDFPVFASWGLEEKPALLLGMDVLGVFAELTLNYRHQEVGLKPRANLLSLH